MIKFKQREILWICGVLPMIFLAGCVGFSDVDRIEQAKLQREAIWPDQSISIENCPLVTAGYSSAYALPAVQEKRVCGHPAPFAVSGLEGAASVRFSTEAKINCVMLSQLHRFFAEEVQPLAMATYGQPVAEIRVAASYSCRPRNNKRGATLSEHGTMNAIDISALTLADGRVLDVDDDWHGYGKKGSFLRKFNREACKYFTTVIGPAGDKYHQDHIHLDHGRGEKPGSWRLCQ